ncbi:SWI/SNF complex subunit SMARCC2-like [Oopsacas minuta]|uniref:SWI/SNF complex subunit SMARCC2-like n=1 Tax=Oopsacas minuta TaxID=111878 RepID=A0AAV7JQ78_9METZ|nr:SWI/SNF complex subunit SMARCC2-like [Oopsacas minuta]
MSDIIKKQNGAPDPKYYEQQEVINTFEEIRIWLINNCRQYIGSDLPTNKQLATITAQLLVFQEESFGKNASNPPLTKLPYRLINDVTPGGGLSWILATCLRVKQEQNWRRLDFTSPARADKNTDLYLQIHRDLEANGVWKPPRIAFVPFIPSDKVHSLSELVESRQGKVLNDIETADSVITHIVHPSPPEEHLDDEHTWYRVIAREPGKGVLVHWIYFPDSYDTWLQEMHLFTHTADLIPEMIPRISAENPPNQTSPIHVNARWLSDLELFNEWPNEEDYLMLPLSQPDLVGHNLASIPGISQYNQVYYRVTTPVHKGYARKVYKIASRPTNEGSSDGEESSSESNSYSRRASKKRSRNSSSLSSIQGALQTSSKRKRGIKTKSSNSKQEYSDEETLPQETPLLTQDTIMEFNNTEYILSKESLTNQSSRSYISATSMPIVNEDSMLQHVQVLPEGSVIEDGSLTAERVRELERTHQAELQRLQLQLENERHIRREKQTITNTKVVHIDTLSPQGQTIVIPSYAAWFDYDSIHGIEKRALPEFFLTKNKSKTPEIYCSYRNFMIDIYRLNPKEFLTVTACRRNLVGDVCAIMRVHGFLEMWGLINYQVDKDRKALQMGPSATNAYNILVDMPLGIQPLPPHKPQQDKDHIETTKSIQVPTSSKATIESGEIPRKISKDVRPWTHTETEILLSAIEANRDDWNKVSEMVPSRTQEECILQFLQLPIEDPFLESEKWPDTMKNTPIPFSKQGNPVMSAVAFLASLVDNRIAKSAVKAAIEEYNCVRNEPPKNPEIEKHKVVDANPEKSDGTQIETGGQTVAEMDEDQITDTEGNQSEANHDDKLSVTEDKTFGDEEPANDDAKDLPTSSRPEEPADNSDTATIEIGGATALAITSLKARQMMQLEERRIQQFVAHIVECQMKKFQMKMNYFEELESVLNQQRESQAIQREQLLQEKQNLYQERLAIQNSTGFPIPSVCVSSSQRVFTEHTQDIPPHDVTEPVLLVEPEQPLDLGVKPDFDEITKALETEELSQQVSIDAEIKDMIEVENDESLFLQEDTSPMETSEFTRDQTDITNQSEFNLDRETSELIPVNLDQPTDHIFDESTKDSASIPLEPDSPNHDFADVSNLEPQDQDESTFVHLPPPYDESESNLTEIPEFVGNEDTIVENSNTDGIVEEPVDNDQI